METWGRLKLFFLVSIIAVSSCTDIRTFQPTATAEKSGLPPIQGLPETTAATPTSPPVPELESHEWQPEAVLVSFGSFSGDGVSNPPAELTLLANGSLFVSDAGLYRADLSRSEVCQLLNTIEQTGFLEYDPSVINYDAMGDGAGGVYINVDAWKKQHFYLQLLSEFINSQVDERYYTPPILPPIREVYQLLKSYCPNGMEPTEFNGMLSLRAVESAGGNNIIPWPTSLFSLADYYSESNCQFIATRALSNSEFEDVFALTRGALNTYVSDGDRLFNIEILWLLPEQRVPACSNDPGFQPEFQITNLPETITCTPNDGILATP
jgi:hypothetical protein